MKFTAVGDAIIGRRIQKDFVGFGELSPFIMQGDARFFNLETTLNYEGDCYASQFSGGTYLRTNPEVLEDLKKFGFNITTFNNNHTLDYSYNGLLKTLEYLNKSGLVHTGVGRNLAEASAPKYLDTESGRVALISVSTTFAPSMLAGTQTERIAGRPGVNGVRLSKTSIVSAKDLEFLKKLAQKTEINAEREFDIKAGYELEFPAGYFEYGNEVFKVGDKPALQYTLNKADVERIGKSIREAEHQADYIIISVHSHELVGNVKETVPEFLRELSHKCIDMGANAIIGHGPHFLRPIEVYNDCPIFYSLGDFILQLYNVEFAPDEMYKKYGLNNNETVYELLKKRSKDFTIGLMTDEKMFETVIPYWETENGRLKKLLLMPVMATKEGKKSEIGLPRRDYSPKFADRLAEISRPYGVDIFMNEDKLLECRW